MLLADVPVARADFIQQSTHTSLYPEKLIDPTSLLSSISFR